MIGTTETRARAVDAASARACGSDEIARKSERFELRLEPLVLERWRSYAVSDGVPLSELVVCAVEHYLARRNGHPRG